MLPVSAPLWIASLVVLVLLIGAVGLALDACNAATRLWQDGQHVV